jgi:hypothetical protein
MFRKITTFLFLLASIVIAGCPPAEMKERHANETMKTNNSIK